MLKLLNADEMRRLEQQSIEDWGMPALLLQEHAALGALGALDPQQKLHVLAGPGNNGGDALALARLARLRGQHVEVWTLNDIRPWVGTAALQAQLWEGLGGTYRQASDIKQAVSSFNGIVIDGLFGLGSRPPLRGEAALWVGALNALKDGPEIVSLDLPSGLDPSSSEIPENALKAHRTFCFGQLKVCHGLFPAKRQCGEILKIALPLRDVATARLALLDDDFFAKAYAPLGWDAHKRDAGHVAIRAGRIGMSGAAVMAAWGAHRSGAGLVTLLVPEDIRAEVAAQLPETMVQTDQGRVPEGVDALLVGPGGATDIPEWSGPMVLDASALKPGEGPKYLQRPMTVLTPHGGEFERLFNLPASKSAMTRIEQLQQLGDFPAILVLKGAQSLISGGGNSEIWINPTGHPGLATGGTGDFLAGMVLAQLGGWARAGTRAGAGAGVLRERIALSVWLHGKAADRLGHGPLMVRDMAASLAELHRFLCKENVGAW